MPPIEPLPMNLSRLIRIQDRPKIFDLDVDSYEYFNYVLPTEFIKNGTQQLRSISGNYHNNIFGMSFTFENVDGSDPIETPLFGVSKYVLDPYAYVD